MKRISTCHSVRHSELCIIIISSHSTLFLANLPIYILGRGSNYHVSWCDLVVLIEISGLRWADKELWSVSMEKGHSGNCAARFYQPCGEAASSWLPWYTLCKQMAHTYNPSFWESEAGGLSMDLRATKLFNGFWDHPGLHMYSDLL